MRSFILIDEEVRRRAVNAIWAAETGMAVKISEPTRTLEQNSLLWPLLDCLAKQVNWHGNKLTDEEWKDVLSASLRKQKVVPGIDGNFVVCGQRTSKMSKRDFSELIELIYAFGTQQGVNFDHAKV